MSSIIVELCEFDVIPHSNADNLAIAKLRKKAWQCVVKKDQFPVGYTGKGVYFPPGCVLPEELVKRNGLEKMAHNGRLKTIRLRGELSEGLILPVHKVVEEGKEYDFSDNLATALGVTKYKPPTPVQLSGELEPIPEGWHKYTDIENVKNFPEVFAPGEGIFVTEKLHGANLSVYKYQDRLWVFSRNLCLKRNPHNSYWRAIIPMEDKLLQRMEEGMILYGELLGVQDLKYGYENGNVGVRFFDLAQNGRYKDYSAFCEFLGEVFGVDWVEYVVPLLAIPEGYDYALLEKFSKGNTSLANGKHLREGLVFRPFSERYHGKIGRVILKFISDDYLTSVGEKSEWH